MGIELENRIPSHFPPKENRSRKQRLDGKTVVGGDLLTALTTGVLMEDHSAS